MSRTDKDRPYWVKVQDEGVERHHHHATYRRGGYSKFEKVFDANGDPVMEDREVKLTAKRVIETVPRLKAVPYSKEAPYWDRNKGWYYTEWKMISATVANPAYSEAEHLIAMGMPDALVLIRVDKVQKLEETWVNRSVECDYDPEASGRDYYWKNNCGKELPYWKAGYSCRCSWCKPAEEPRSRRKKRDFLKKMTKAANSGEEAWEDDFNELDLSQPDMHHRGWC